MSSEAADTEAPRQGWWVPMVLILVAATWAVWSWVGIIPMLRTGLTVVACRPAVAGDAAPTVAYLVASIMMVGVIGALLRARARRAHDWAVPALLQVNFMFQAIFVGWLVGFSADLAVMHGVDTPGSVWELPLAALVSWAAVGVALWLPRRWSPLRGGLVASGVLLIGWVGVIAFEVVTGGGVCS